MGFCLLLGSMNTELNRANPHSYPFDLLQGLQEFFPHPNPEETNVALILERRPFARHEALRMETVQLGHRRHDLAVLLVFQHRRQLCSDGGVFSPLVLSPCLELVLGHLDVSHQLLGESLRVRVQDLPGIALPLLPLKEEVEEEE